MASQMKPMVYPDSIPEEWHEIISASMAIAGGYKTYFTLISGSAGDDDWCTQWDLHVWATTHERSLVAGAFKDANRHFNDAVSGSADGLGIWLAASGSSDQSGFYISGSHYPPEDPILWDPLKSTNITDLAANQTGSLLWNKSIEHTDYKTNWVDDTAV